MKPGGGRAKGHAFEREVANLFKPIFPEARRGLSQTRSGSEVPDVEHVPWWVECKRGRKTNIKAAMAQACEALAKSGSFPRRPPLVVTRDDHSEALATMRFEDFLELARELVELRAKGRE